VINASLQDRKYITRVADLRSSVTICIGALCNGGRTIVTASDQMVGFSSGLSADHLALKVRQVHANWQVLSASNDAEYVTPILDRAATLLYKHDYPDQQQVINAIGRACDDKLHEHVKVKALSKYNMSTREFWLEGRKKLTDDVFNRLAVKIDAVKKLDCDFLVCGFEEFGDGHLCGIGTDHGGQNYDSPGFWAIGEGADVAMNLMAYYADRYMLTKHTCSLSDCLYLVSAAKFMAEQTHIAIGRETAVTICEFGKPSRWFAPTGISMARKKWEREGSPKVPKNLFHLGEFVCTSEELTTPSERAIKLIGKRRPIITGHELG